MGKARDRKGVDEGEHGDAIDATLQVDDGAARSEDSSGVGGLDTCSGQMHRGLNESAARMATWIVACDSLWLLFIHLRHTPPLHWLLCGRAWPQTWKFS